MAEFSAKYLKARQQKIFGREKLVAGNGRICPKVAKEAKNL
jgi:hypothetical protein